MAAGMVNTNEATCDVRCTVNWLATQQGPCGTDTREQEPAAVSHQHVASWHWS